MTTIAWDGKTLAADRMGDRSGLKREVVKAWRLANGDILAVAGSASHGLVLKRWYEDGADPATFPAFQADENGNSHMVVVTGGRCGCYGSQPYPVFEEDSITAYGSGRDFAISAMALGLTAPQAVEFAARFDIGTGMGVDVFEPVTH